MMKLHIRRGFLYILVVICCVTTVVGCSKKLAIETMPTILNTKNATVKKMQFSLSDSASVTVKLKNLDSNKELLLNQLPVKVNHEVLLAGLKPDQDYSIQILENKRVLTQIDSFHTNPIEENIVSIYERTNTENPFNGYLLTQRRLVRGSVYMIDNESDLVWYQMVDGQPKVSHWTKNNEILMLVGHAKHNNSAGDKIRAYTIDGEVSYQIDLTKLGLVAHHEVKDYQGDIFSLVYDTIPNMVNGKLEKAVSSAIVRFNKEGKEIWRWSTFDVKNPVDIPFDDMDGDWGHANAFDFDEDGNIIVSYRDWSQIWKIDVKTGERIWVLGENGDFEFNAPLFNKQHAIHKNPKGDYMLFDNGKKNRQSRIVSYKLVEDKAESIISINLPEHLYADKMGNVQVLPNDNILLCSPRSRSIAVIDSNEEIVFHINTGIPDPYRAICIPSFYSTK